MTILMNPAELDVQVHRACEGCGALQISTTPARLPDGKLMDCISAYNLAQQTPRACSGCGRTLRVVGARLKEDLDEILF
jgi:hypothetical protein